MNDSIFMTYPGGKNGSGTYQKIINLMPPHHTYVEAFLGGGAILLAKRPAAVNVGIDIDDAVIHEWWRKKNQINMQLQLVNENALAWLYTNHLGGNLTPDTLVYCDPPYLMSTRTSQRQFYTFEMGEEAEHRALIGVLRELKCMVMLSGYWSPLYADLLHDWRTFSFQAMTRGGTMATEWVWMNYPAPVALHDYRYLGDNFREREHFKRQKERWTERLAKMPVLKRQALLLAIEEMGDSTNWAPAANAEMSDVDMQGEDDVFEWMQVKKEDVLPGLSPSTEPTESEIVAGEE